MSKISGIENWTMRELADVLNTAELSHSDLIGALILICRKLEQVEFHAARVARVSSMLANGVQPD